LVSVYNSADELPALEKYPNFSLRRNWHVKALESDGDGYRVIGDETLSKGSAAIIRAKKVVLAGGTFSTTQLALQLQGRFEESLPMENNPSLTMAFWRPSRLGASIPKEVHGMAQLSYTLPLPGWDGYGLGMLHEAGAMAVPDLASHMPFTGRGSTVITQTLLSSLLLGMFNFPGSLSANTVRLKRTSQEKGGRLAIQGGAVKNLDEVSRRSVREIGRQFRRLGLYLLPGSVSTLPPGAEVHYCGTLPMGREVSAMCEVNGHPNLFAVDGAVFSDLSSKHLTLTVMANADRVAHLIAAGWK
jgi:hypothetical protein